MAQAPDGAAHLIGIRPVAAARRLRGLNKTGTQDSVDGIGSGLDVARRMAMPVTPTEILRRHMNYYHPRPFRRLWMEFRA